VNPREKIAAIFAKGHSTTSPHERDNAVTLGTRLAEKAGLSLDLFDVPGRVRAEPKPPTMTVHAYTGNDMAAAFAAMALAAQRARAQAEAFDRATAAAAAAARATAAVRAQQAAYRAGRQSPICSKCGSRTTNGVRHECPRSRS